MEFARWSIRHGEEEEKCREGRGGEEVIGNVEIAVMTSACRIANIAAWVVSPTTGNEQT